MFSSIELVNETVQLTNILQINENTKNIYQFQSDEQVEWSLKEGGDSSLFEINKKNGQLSFKQNADYENPLDLNKDNNYSVDIQAKDNAGNITLQKLQITIENDNTPNDPNDPLHISKTDNIVVKNIDGKKVSIYQISMTKNISEN